jgi:hypothetical protein
MASKYDRYWTARLKEIRSAAQVAAAGIAATVDVAELRQLGDRQSWYGVVEVRGRAASGASMAHAVSLGRIVAASGICAAWPERTFRLAVGPSCVLTITSMLGAAQARPAEHEVPGAAQLSTASRPGSQLGVGVSPLIEGQQLRRFAQQVRVTPSITAAAGGIDLNRTLLVIPCCKSKDGVADPGLPVVSVGDLIGREARILLDEGRRLAFRRPDTTLDLSSPLRPALAYYTGQPYITPGVRSALVEAIHDHGLQCLIISGGYGVLRAEEPIHWYEAYLGNTRSVWARRLPAILAEYVARQKVIHSYVVLSSVYSACVPPLTPTERRFVPSFTRGIDHGSPMTEVPARVGAELADLLPALIEGQPPRGGDMAPAARP